jgi:ubiquinone/menaquinone biosynthesis C-methylase UbiE
MTRSHDSTNLGADEWSEWLLNQRYGGDAARRRIVLEAVERIGDRVLDGARLGPGMTLVDVGTGDGLVPFRAIDRIGPSLRVILTDLSAPLLRHAEGVAVERGVRHQCAFLQGTAEKLDGVGDATVDVVTTRAVLAYVADKGAAFQEFARVLKPGGRLSIAEPVLQDEAFETTALGMLIETQPAHPDINVLRLLHRMRAAQYPSTQEQIWRNPLTNYSERDLIRFLRTTGFVNIHLELHIDVSTSPVDNWEIFLGTSPHPWAPTAGAVLAERFSEAERNLYEHAVRPNIESRRSITTESVAYLTAEKPPTLI